VRVFKYETLHHSRCSIQMNKMMRFTNALFVLQNNN